MSFSILNHKFLLDENVRIELFRHLKTKGCNVVLAPKSTADSKIANISKKEERIVVTNDEDYTEYSKDEIFSVVWLRIPQNDPKALISSFKKLIAECKNFSGKIITLTPKDWNEANLYEEVL